MKKIILNTLVIVAITAVSCKKEQTAIQSPIIPNEYNVSLRKNRLVFATIADYEKAVDNRTQEEQKIFLRTIENFNNFTSCSEKLYIRGSIDAAITDDYFKSILNTDLAVQIGEHIFRVNPLTEKVYALPVANEDQYNDLVNENTANPNIKVFSTNDNVLELIQNHNALRGLICSQSGIGGTSATTTPTFWSGITYYNGVPHAVDKYMQGIADFNKFGIYYSLYAKVAVTVYGSQNTTSDGVGIAIEPCYYKPRCKDGTGPYNTYTASGGGGEHRFQSYQGSTNLNQVRLRIKGAADGHVTDWAEIRVNY